MANDFLRGLRVYFTSAAVQDEERRRVYTAVRSALVDLGCSLTYDWLEDKTKHTPRELFNKTTEAMEKADVVVADVSYPSTGVGQQISQALAKKIPVIALKASWMTPSKFTPGAEGELMKYLQYDQRNLGDLLKKNLAQVGKQRFVKFNFISTPEINTVLEEESEKEGISRSELLRRVIREWIMGREAKKG